MIKDVTTVKEVMIETPNKAGVLASITEAVSAKGVNILALTAATVADKAWIRVVTSDNVATIKAVKTLGWKAVERDVVLVALDNTVGAAQAVSLKLASANINIESVYGSAWDTTAPAIVVVPSNVSEAVKVLKEAVA